MKNKHTTEPKKPLEPIEPPKPGMTMPGAPIVEKIKNKKLLFGAVFVVVLVLAGTAAFYTQAPRNSQVPANTATPDSKAALAKPSMTVDKTGAFKLASQSAGECSALLPSGWAQPTTNETSTTFDAFSPDKAMYAGYGHQAINTGLAPYAGAYSPPMNDPDLYSSDPATVALAYTKIIVANLEGDSAVSYTNETNDTIGDYQLRSVASKTHKGVVFFHKSGFAGDGVNYSYSVPMYFALASTAAWQTNGLSLARVSASITCNAQLVARSNGPDIGGDASKDDAKDENGSDAGYNPQLGTEYVHDESTGENYVVDPSRDWSSTGPNGGGYYLQKGTDYTQLLPGRSD